MNDWPETTLGEICDSVGGVIQTGPFGSQLHESDYSTDGVPVVMPKDIIEDKISTDSIARVPAHHADRLGKHKLLCGDIVYGRRGDIGRQTLVRKNQQGWLCGTGCLRISLGDSIIDPLFLHYYLRQQSVIRWIANQAIGATLPNLNTAILRSVPVKTPPPEIQRRIAFILSAYDDLIENNLRRVRILEELGSLLYKEWFIDFRFPDYPAYQFVQSTLGLIPDGWEVGPLSDAFVLQRGFDLPKSLRVDGSVPIYAATGVVGFHNQSKAAAPGVITGRSGTIGEVIYVQEDFWPLNTTLWVKEYRKAEPLMAYYILRGVDLQQFNSGAAVPSLDRNVIHKLDTIIPPRDLQHRFQEIVGAVFRQVRTLTLATQKLRNITDLLLPRLMSGQIDVSTFDDEAMEETFAAADVGR
jgi:type I restriction enzyme, S subunit